MRFTIFTLFFLAGTGLYAQKIEQLTGDTKTSLRGLSVVNDESFGLAEVMEQSAKVWMEAETGSGSQ